MVRDYNDPQVYLEYFNENKKSRSHFHTFVMRYRDWKTNPETEWLADHMEKELEAVPDDIRIARFSSEDRLRNPLIRHWNVMNDEVFEVTGDHEIPNITGMVYHAVMRLRGQEGLLERPNMENALTLLPRFPNLNTLHLSGRLTEDEEVFAFFSWLYGLELGQAYKTMQVHVSMMKKHWLPPVWIAHFQRWLKKWGDSLPSKEGLTLLVSQGKHEFGWHDGEFTQAVESVPGSGWVFIDPK